MSISKASPRDDHGQADADHRQNPGERQALRVPDDAVVRRGQLEGLFVVKDDRAALRWIRVGRSRDGVTEVLSGLEAGESYVVDPPAGLNDGSPVVR